MRGREVVLVGGKDGKGGHGRVESILSSLVTALDILDIDLESSILDSAIPRLQIKSTYMPNEW
jgi:hypothetical protein